MAELRAWLEGREVQVCAAVLLLGALADWPYGYYQFLRLAVCAAGGFCAWRAWMHRQPLWGSGMVGLVLLFNPILTVHFRRGEWAWIDALAALAFIACPSAKKNDLGAMTLTKLEVAVLQLDQAIRLFLEGDLVSSLTLAGASEEILGRLSERAGQPVAAEQIAAFHMDDTDPALADDKRRKVLFTVMNRARNEAKHAGKETETHFVIEEIFPLQMIMRAIPMARRLGLPPSREAQMVRWIKEHPESTG